MRFAPLALVLVACSGAPSAVDAGGRDASDRTWRDAGPGPGCGAPVVLARAEILRIVDLAVSGDRYAVLWSERSDTPERTLAILAPDAAVVALRSTDVGNLVVGIEDGFLLVDVGYATPGRALRIDLDGEPIGAPMPLPSLWQMLSRPLVDGSIVRAAGGLTLLEDRAHLVVDLAAPSPRFEMRPPTWPAWARSYFLATDRDLVVSATPTDVAEIAYPGGESGFAHHVPDAPVELHQAAYDSVAGEWVALAGAYSDRAPPHAAIYGSDASIRIIPLPDPPPFHYAVGGLAMGEDTVGMVVHDDYWDETTPTSLWFLLGSAREPVGPVLVDGVAVARIAWHPPSGTYALATQSGEISGPVTIGFRCGVTAPNP